LTVPETSLAAGFDGAGEPFRLERFSLVAPPPGHILAKVLMTTLCGSDLHTVSGRRTEATPLILGHEILAQVVELGEGVARFDAGEVSRPGDRISFTIMAACGACRQCRSGIPQKCDSLFKYGHASCDGDLPLSGGLAEYIYLRPGTAVYAAPAGLSDAVVCPANCALATVVNALEAGSVQPGERVWVQGAGLLGLYAIALLSDLGAGEIIVTDVSDQRLELARGFGAHCAVNVSGVSDDDVVARIGKDSCDCVLEVCGEPSAVPPALSALGLRGRCVLVGLVSQGANVTVDGNTVTRKYLTLTGVHNYAPRHLKEALAFLERTTSDFPYEDLVPRALSLVEVEEAFALAERRAAPRVAVVPTEA